MKLNKKDFPVIFMSLVLILYLWRLIFNGDFMNLVLLTGLIIGFSNSAYYFIKPKFLGGISLYFIITGVILSFLFAAFNRGSIAEQLELNSTHTELRLIRMLEGLLIFLMIVLNIKSAKDLTIFLNLFLISTVFFTLLFLFGLSKSFLGIIGVDVTFTGDYQTTLGIDTFRQSFETLDESSFGNILSVATCVCLYRIASTRRKTVLYISLIILFITCMLLGISRSAIGRLIIGIVIFYFFTYKMNLKRLFAPLLIIAIFLVIILSTKLGQDALLRFTEVSDNLGTFYKEGTLESRDSFQYRLVRSLVGMPHDAVGWIMGTGGRQTAMIRENQDHIEYTNWLWQYGLITFIPFITYFIFFIRRLIFINNTTKNWQTKCIAALGLSTIFGLMINMIATPQFYFIWIWWGFIAVLINISENFNSNNYIQNTGPPVKI